MSLKLCYGLAALILALVSPAAFAQQAPGAAGKATRALSEQDVRDLLVSNSPWDSKSATPGQIYSYRTTFVLRRNELIAEVMRYSTSERGDSVVSVKEGRVVWQDTSGADVAVSLEDGGELVGTAVSRTTSLKVVFRPRP